MAGNLTSIRYKSSGSITSATDKVVRDNLGRVRYCAIPDIFIPYDSLTDAQKARLDEGICSKYWARLEALRAVKDQKKKEQKAKRIIDW